MNDNRPLAVLGATGYTGRLVVEQARALGIPLRLVGRRAEALEELAGDGEEVRVADAGHEAELIEAFDGAFAVASTAGPFLDVGTKPVGAAIAVGAHYLDTSAEQAFARVVYDGFGESADERDLVLLTSFGFDYAPGDFAARLAAEGLDEPLEEVVVAYATKRQPTSRGTRETIGHTMGQPQVAWEGRVVSSRFGKTTRRVRFPTGERSVVEWGGTEPLTVPRHTNVRRVRSYFAAPRARRLRRSRRAVDRPDHPPPRPDRPHAVGRAARVEPLDGRRRGPRRRCGAPRDALRLRHVRHGGAPDRPTAQRRFAPAKRAGRARSRRRRHSTSTCSCRASDPSWRSVPSSRSDVRSAF